MRAIIALTAAVTTLLMGFWAIGEQASSTAPDSGTSESYNSTHRMGELLYDGLGMAAGESVAWFGVAAVILIAAGFLVAVSRGGGR